MNIALHSNQLEGRGTGKAIYDYAIGLNDILGHNVTIVSSKQNPNESLNIIKNAGFDVILYDKPNPGGASYSDRISTKQVLEKLVIEHKFDFFHFLKAGPNDNITPENCKTGVHCIFTMSEPHGNVYAGVSHYVAKKAGKELWAPASMVKNCIPTENIRKKLNIPDSALVIGRHGGKDTFNIKFVHDAIKNILNHRNDIYFLFLSTEPFITHERVVFLPWVEREQDKYNFIHACDVMLHGRIDGETFGIAVAEFSVANKPVITWSGKNAFGYDTCHIDLLNDKAIIYNDISDLGDIMYSIDKTFIQQHNWDKYSEEYNQKAVINRFDEVFLK